MKRIFSSSERHISNSTIFYTLFCKIAMSAESVGLCKVDMN